MLPNHAPLTIAEQFGTLEAHVPGAHRPRPRPGARAATRTRCTRCAATRGRPTRFPQDVLELQAYLAGETRVPGVDAIPGKGSPRAALHPRLVAVRRHARRRARPALRLRLALRAAAAGARRRRLPARVPAVGAARPAVRDRRRQRPRRRHDRRRRRSSCRPSRRVRAAALFGRGQALTDEEADQLLAQGAAQHVDQMLTYAAVGTPAEVGDYLDAFAKTADADELIVAHQAPTIEARLRSVTLLAEAMVRA